MAKVKETILIYDAGTQSVKQTIYCPVCKSESEIEYKEPPEIKTIIIECSACSKENPTPKQSKTRIGY